MSGQATSAADRPTAHQRLRSATAADHTLTDAAFGRFDLGDRGSYADFLRAHSRALPAVEDALSDSGDLPPIEARMPALREDLHALGVEADRPIPFAPPAGTAAAWGTRYVIEGSRLGGVMLARMVAPDLPRAFLASRHGAGEWRGFCALLDAAAEGEDWFEDALAAARATFRHYAAAAA